MGLDPVIMSILSNALTKFRIPQSKFQIHHLKSSNRYRPRMFKWVKGKESKTKIKSKSKEEEGHARAPTPSDPKPNIRHKMCKKCKGKGTISEWDTVAYIGSGYFERQCHTCDGHGYCIVNVYDE